MLLPELFSAERIVIQLFELLTVQSQPWSVATATLPVVAVKPCAAFVGVSAKTQGRPACVIVLVWPLTAMKPVRPAPLVFAASV